MKYKYSKKGFKLSTITGRFLERMPYSKIGILIAGIILICSLIYFLLNPLNHGTNQKNLCWTDSLYFSIVTFSSLGYGDILPIGFSKIISGFEVLSGLFFVAIFVGKIASERLFALLLLTYSSENERRITDFSKDIMEKREAINLALNDHEHDQLYYLGRQTRSFMSSIFNYLQFHIYEGGYDTFTNMAAPRRLYKNLLSLQMIALETVRTFGSEKRTLLKFEDIIYKIESISFLVIPFHKNNHKTIEILNKMALIANQHRKWIQLNLIKKQQLKSRNIITESLLNKVRKKLPIQPWEKNIHKKIALELNLSNSLTHKCITILIDKGEFTNMKNEE